MTFKCFGSIYLIIAYCVNGSTEYNILAFFPISVHSHLFFFHTINDGFSRKGHNITLISHFPSNFNLSNYRKIVLEFEENTLKSVEAINNLATLNEDGKVIKYLMPSICSAIG